MVLSLTPAILIASVFAEPIRFLSSRDYRAEKKHEILVICQLLEQSSKHPESKISPVARHGEQTSL
jgi:hypothetical protein